jgi:hypothetical protein
MKLTDVKTYQLLALDINVVAYQHAFAAVIDRQESHEYI